MSEGIVEKAVLTPQVRELLESFMPEAISSGLNERYKVGLTEDPDISHEARAKILAESPPEVRKVLEGVAEAKQVATDPVYPFAVKKEPMLVSEERGKKYQDFLQLYKVDPATGEVLKHSLKGVLTFTDSDRFADGLHIFGNFTYQDIDFVIRLYEAQESLGWQL
jgi:hypothetical protein